MMLFDKPDAGRESRRGFHLGRKNNAHNGENGSKSVGTLRCAQQKYGTMASKQGKEQLKKGDAQNAADNKGNKISACRISEDFPGRDIVFAYLRQKSDI